ncbi:MAG: hypothetical protein WCK42_09035, partial [Myxococcaceae bacterium]
SDGMYRKVSGTPRKAFAVVLNLGSTEKCECVLDITQKHLESKTAIGKGQPASLFVEQIESKKMIAADPRVIKGLLDRGLDPKNLYVEPWAAGDLSQEDLDKTHRFIRGSLYYRENSINPYARPIEGLSAIYDITSSEVVKVVDSIKVPLQPNARDFFKVSQKAQKAPDGFTNTNPNIKLTGSEVEWRGWKLRFQVHAREGLVLYDVRREKDGEYVSILERAAMSEMVVPYADPDSSWFWKSAFDQGEYGIGTNTNSLMRGVHFPVSGLSFPANFASETGELNSLEDVVAIYEKEGGVLWSHYDWDSNTQAARSGKELVILSFFTIGNYDYGQQWTFREDGSIDMQVLLSGVLLTKGSSTRRCGRCENLSLFSAVDQFGTVVDQNLIAIAHQHHFNFRLDFAVGGGHNSIAEISLKHVNEDENPFGNAFLIKEHLLRTEKEAVGNVDHQVAKHWWIFNKSKKNALNHYAGYLLEPGKTSAFYGDRNSSVFKRAPFLGNNFYVTQFHPREMHAAGDYPSQSEGDGIPVWIDSRDDAIVQKDLVVWLTPVATHLPCAEEWPIMPLHRAGFSMRPMGIYLKTPLKEMEGL